MTHACLMSLTVRTVRLSGMRLELRELVLVVREEVWLERLAELDRDRDDFLLDDLCDDAALVREAFAFEAFEPELVDLAEELRLSETGTAGGIGGATLGPVAGPAGWVE